MVFPSLMFKIEPGLVSQFSALSVIAFSYFLHRLKKVALIVLVLLILLATFFQTKVFAMMAVPGNTYQNYNTGPWGNYYNNNLNYYGRPWGYVPPVYFYPGLQYHSVWGYQPSYFYPHQPSPYAPVDCPWCQLQQNYGPQFPNNQTHSDGTAS